MLSRNLQTASRRLSTAAASVSDQKLIPTAGPLSKFAWEDPLSIDAMLTEEERGMRDAARTFCKEELMPGIVEANRNESSDGKGLMKVSIEAD